MNESLFGTDGIRKRVGEHPLTQEDLPQLGYAVGQWIVHTYGSNAHIIIGCDTRISSDFVKSGFYTGLLCHPVTIVDAGVISTPAISALMKYQTSFTCGVVISASHNHYTDNGIKIFIQNGKKLSTSDELTITTIYNNRPFKVNYERLGSIIGYANAIKDYTDIVMQLCSFTQPLHTKKVVIDCAHGATSEYAHDLIALSGAEVICINNAPTGTNINDNCGAVHPERLADAVVKNNANCGFSFDGDGDRIIAVTSTGEIKDGDDILALLHSHPLYASQKAVTGTIMSNQGLALFLERMNTAFLRTSVGDKYVLQKLQEEQLLLGGEPSGHIIMRDYLDCGDGIVTALKLLEVLEQTDNWAMKTFAHTPSLLVNVHVTKKRAISDPDLQKLITTAQEKIPHGRLLVRYSGTENLLRILVEDDNQELAHTIATQLGTQFALQLAQ